jgi:murein DD-endopeptidase MepM/ murein hydrolase activator NlpD
MNGQGIDENDDIIPASPTLTAQPAAITPVVPTAANGFGTNITEPYLSEYDQLAQRRYQESQSPVNAEAIRKQKLAQFQAEIDATNQIYTNLISKAQVQGQDRLGQTRAIQARSGTLNSARGTSQTEQVASYNQDIESDISARQQAAVSAIMIEAQNRADAEITKREEAKRLGADQYLAYLAGTEERKSKNASAVLQSLLAQGLALEDIPQEQFTQIANSLRMTPQELVNVYKGELAQAEAAAAQEEYERSLKDREFGLEVGKFGFEQEKFGAEFGLKGQQFEFDQKKFAAELGLKYDELNRLLNNDQLDAQVKGVEIQKKLAEIQELNLKNGTGGVTAIQNEKNLQNVNDALEAVNGLITDPGLSRAVGKSGIFNFIPGSKGADFQARLDRVKSLITLPQLEKLKGLGAMSDREFKTLSDAAAALNPKMSEAAFKTELERVQKALESTKVKLETNSFFNEFENGGSEGTNPKAAFKSLGDYLRNTGNGKVVTGSKYHKGPEVDIDGKIGDPIPAFESGRVLALKDDGGKGYGKHVIVQNSAGEKIIYAHLSAFNVKQGQTVASGFPLGKMGNSGNVTPGKGGDGSHLHIEKRDPSGRVIALDNHKSHA